MSDTNKARNVVSLVVILNEISILFDQSFMGWMWLSNKSHFMTDTSDS